MSNDGSWKVKVDLTQEQVYRIVLALSESLAANSICDRDCDDCGLAAVELLEKFIEIDDGLALRETFRLDV